MPIPCQLLVDSKEAEEALARALSGACCGIDLQMLTFEGDRVGRRFADILIGRAREGLCVRALVDYYSLMVISDVFVAPGYLFSSAVRREYHATRQMFSDMAAGGVHFRITNRPGRLFRGLFHRNHKKMVVIDGKTAFLGGINLSEHNFAWHDLMIRLHGPVAERVSRDFTASWTGHPDKRIDAPDDLFEYIGDSRRLRERVDTLIRNARREILLESPYAGGWILERLAIAALNGVRVSVIVPARNNFPLFSLLHDFYSRMYGPRGLRILRYRGHTGMTHLKALLVDDTVVLGSSNFSMHFLEESALISRHPALVSAVRSRVFERDIAESA